MKKIKGVPIGAINDKNHILGFDSESHKKIIVFVNKKQYYEFNVWLKKNPIKLYLLQ